MVRQRITSSQNFIHDSYNASLDFPTYIPWQTLSSEVNDKLRQGSVKISRRYVSYSHFYDSNSNQIHVSNSNRIEWADTINEEAERPHLEKQPLLRSESRLSEKGVSDAVQGGE